MRTLAVVSKGKRVVFDAQFTANASDATGRHTTGITNSVTFSGGNAVWASASPPAYISTNEEDFLLHKNLTVSTRLTPEANIIGKSVWTITNSALDSYVRLLAIGIGIGSFVVIVNGTQVSTSDSYPSGTSWDVVVKFYTSGLVQIYVNGTLDGTAMVTPLPSMNRKLYIGYSPTFTTFGFQGSMNFLTVEEG